MKKLFDNNKLYASSNYTHLIPKKSLLVANNYLCQFYYYWKKSIFFII